MIVCDNLLWKGQVAEGVARRRRPMRCAHFNKRIATDPRLHHHRSCRSATALGDLDRAAENKRAGPMRGGPSSPFGAVTSAAYFDAL